jgi:hypothetical protein
LQSFAANGYELYDRAENVWDGAAIGMMEIIINHLEAQLL